MWFIRFLSWAWTLWYSLPHLLLCYLFYGVKEAKWVNGRWVMQVNKIKVGYKSTSGQAVGMSMALTENSTYLFKHEYEHTKQALWFGPFWPFVYFGAIVAAKKTTWRQAYLDSYFEVKAREAGHAS